MKSLKDLKGVRILSKVEQKPITGGAQQCDETHRCKPGFYCYYSSGNSGYCLRGEEP